MTYERAQHRVWQTLVSFALSDTTPKEDKEEKVQSIAGFLEDEGSEKVQARKGEGKYNIDAGKHWLSSLSRAGKITVHLPDNNKSRRCGRGSQWFWLFVTGTKWFAINGMALFEDPIMETWSHESND